MLRRLWEYRDLSISMVRRQYQLRYRQSLAGIGWAILPPLITLGMATIVFHQVAKVSTGGAPYGLFAFAALVPWTFFANSVAFAVPSVTGSTQMVYRLAFPRAVLPLSIVGVSLIDLVIAGATYVLFALVTGHGLPITALWFPVLLLVEIVFTVGVALLLTALNVFARDVRLIVPLLVELWLFLTPVMYSLHSVPANLRTFYLLNPMTGLMENFRNILVFGTPPSLSLLVPSLIGAVIFLAVGVWYFGATEARFADVV
jgi:lipopolysaccharide transport system permease protein